jgi:N utilization substance protein B
MGTRRKGRELALQALYQMELTGDDASGSMAELWRHFSEPAVAQAFAAELVHGVLEQRPRIDALITASSEHWRLGRLSQIDRNVLRVATYELLCRRDVPTSVVIDEAIEIARRFGSDDSPVFVNGVLDQVAATLGVKEGRGAL